jgi:hypothetical protein
MKSPGLVSIWWLTSAFLGIMANNVARNYLDRHRIGSFSGLPKFVKSKGDKLGPEKEIEKQLERIDAYTLHRPVYLKPVTRTIVVPGPGVLWGADIMDVTSVTKNQKNAPRYCLLCIDVFSRVAYSSLQKLKNQSDTLSSFKRIFREAKQTPKFLLTDKVFVYSSSCETKS